MLRFLQQEGLDVTGAALGLGAERKDVLRGLCFVRDTGMSSMSVMFPQMRDRAFMMDGRTWTPPDGTPPVASATLWLNAFWAAMVLDDESAADWLTQVPGRVLVHKGILSLPYVYQAINVFRGMRADANGWQALLQETLVKAEDDRQRGPWDDQIMLPVLRMLVAVYAGTDALDARFQEALEAHKTYWSHDERRADPQGLLALGPLAVVRWADSCGFTTTVRSDYAPEWLIRASWPKKA